MTTTSLSVFSWDDALDTSEDTTIVEKPIEYLEFNSPPLALVIAMIQAGKHLSDIVVTLEGIERNNVDVKNVVTAEHQAKADKIYSYFSNKHTMRRMKDEYISKWMMAVEDLCDNRKRINKKSLPILVTLPRFYQENLELESVMREHNTLPLDMIKRGYHRSFDHDLEFVKKIKRRAATKKSDDFYWRTKDKNLVRIRTEIHNTSSGAWDYISKQKTINLKTDTVQLQRIQGYNFVVFEPVLIKEINTL